jgi:cytidylate kinase
MRRLELPTPTSRTWCASQLRYIPELGVSVSVGVGAISKFRECKNTHFIYFFRIFGLPCIFRGMEDKMENLLIRYMDESFLKNERMRGAPGPPLVTLSREYGCPSKLIGQMLVEAINMKARKERSRQWKFINKEILEESARQLHIPEFQIKSMLDADKRGMVLDILTFSTAYGGNQRIRKTVEKVIRSFAHSGYVVMVGRAGVAVTRDHPNSLHVRLTAPIDWRAGEISRIHGVTVAQALKTAADIDAKRTKLIETLLGKKLDPYLFDMAYNCKYLGKEDVVQSIFRLMELKKMI